MIPIVISNKEPENRHALWLDSSVTPTRFRFYNRGIWEDVGDAPAAAYDVFRKHVARLDNPHTVTKAQVGLGNADNTADIDKPVSKPTKVILDTKLEWEELSEEEFKNLEDKFNNTLYIID
jgi:frataxin-like iron-binding protein CyaY